MKLLVVGAGEMGQWLARTVDAEVAFTDIDHEAASAAAATVGGRAVPIDGDERFDTVGIAVPMSVTPETIERHAGRAEDAIVDVSGEMAAPLAAMDEHASDLERASLHPLFAPENAPGSVAVVVGEGGPTVHGVLADVAAGGNAIVGTTPEEHDQAMETIQAAAHAAILSYGVAREAIPQGFSTPVSAALDDVLRQVTDGDPDVYAEIQRRFDGAEAVAEAATEITDADAERFRELFDAARPDDGRGERRLGPAEDDA